jgi:glycosyltransferase involved in cell wall biosynthesis
MRLAYLMSQYPYASTTFIRREILELEKLGFEVDRFAIRSAGHALRDESDLAEGRKTRCILESSPFHLGLNVVHAAARRPAAFGKALALTWRCARRSPRGIPLHLAYLAEACTLVRWLREAGSEHLHAHFAMNAATVAMLTRVLGGPEYSFTVHGPEDFDLAAQLSLDEKIGRARFVVAISHFARSQLYRWCAHAHWDKIQIVRCAIGGAFLADTSAVPKESRFLNIGRLTEAKGQLLLIDAAARLAQSGVDFVLDIIGDGDLRAPIEAAIVRNNLQERVKLLGWQTEAEVTAHLRKARALVLPSFAEGLPVVLMEALGLGRPVVTTQIAGIPELVQPGVNGWLVPAGSVDALTEALREVLATSEERLTAMGRAGAALVARQHDIRTEAEKLAALFDPARTLPSA